MAARPRQGFYPHPEKKLPHCRIIAEDLGILNQKVYDLMAYSGYPGMKILQFAFDGGPGNEYLPHNHRPNAIVYTGTHDNNTSLGWQLAAPKATVDFARQYLAPEQSLVRALVRAALASTAETAILPMQDWLGLGAEARINTPSTLGGSNWCWRLAPGQLTPALAADIRLQTGLYGRLPQP